MVGQEVHQLPEKYDHAWSVGGRVHTGFLMNHHNNMKVLNENNPYAYEIFIARATVGEKPWQSFYHNPQYGVAYMLFHLGSPSYLGNAHCVYPFLHFSLTKADRVASLNMRVGAGVAYVEKTFDRFDNYKNTAISCHLNAMLSLQVEGRIRVADPLFLSGGLAFSHISNGAYRKPNSGLNFVTAFAGARYAFGRKRVVNETSHIGIDPGKRWHYTVYLSVGVKSYSVADGNRYIASGLSLEASRAHLAFTRFSGTLDVFYDTSDYAILREEEVETSRLQTVKPGLAAGYSFLFGSLSANVQAGAYLYTKFREFGWLYQRLALRYEVTNRLNVHFGLKTHLGKADYIEVALGYRIR